MAARQIEVGPVPALALRISYVGELGYELYVATEHGRWLWDALFAAGEEFGVVPVGTAAFNSLRVEKGYRFAGVDMHTEYSPVEAGPRLHRQPVEELVHRPRGGPARARVGAFAQAVLPGAGRP